MPEVLEETFDVEHKNDAEATAFALRIAAELSKDNDDFVGLSLEVMQEGRMIANLPIGRLH